MDKAALLSVRNSHAVERPGSHCWIVLPWTAGAWGLLGPFVAGRFDLSAVVCSSRLSRLRRARFRFCGGSYGLAQNIDLHDRRAGRGHGADSVFAAVENAVIVRADRAFSDLRPDSDGDWRGDLSPVRLGFRLGGQRDSRAYRSAEAPGRARTIPLSQKPDVCRRPTGAT